jgi:hypothetical protein
MTCPKCNHLSDGGNFCGKCGTRLGAVQETAAASEVETIPFNATQAPSNAHLENAKKISKMYLGFFMGVLKKPFSQAQNVGKEHFINGLITVALYAIFIPLMVFLGFKDYSQYVDSPFLNFVLKPAFGYAVFILLVVVYSFAAIKLGKIQASLQEVIARFGTFLVPFVGLFAIATIMALMEMEFFALILFIGFIGSIFTVPPLVIASFKKQSTAGLDVIYGTILTYLATFITLGIMGRILFEMIGSMIEDYVSSLFLF